MASQNNSGECTFVAGTDLAKYLRVTINTDLTVTATAAAGRTDAITQHPVTAGFPVKCTLLTPGKTFFMTVAGTCSAGVVANADAGGKISTAGAGSAFALALQAANQDGEIIEAKPLN